MSCSLRACACVFDAKKADLPCARTTYAPPRICPPQPRFRLAENRNIAPFSARAFLSCPSLDGGVRPSGWGSPQGGPRRICVLKGSWNTNPLPIEEIAMGYRRICHVGRVARIGVRCSARMIARRAFAFEIGRMGMRGSRCRVSEKRRYVPWCISSCPTIRTARRRYGNAPCTLTIGMAILSDCRRDPGGRCGGFQERNWNGVFERNAQAGIL